MKQRRIEEIRKATTLHLRKRKSSFSFFFPKKHLGTMTYMPNYPSECRSQWPCGLRPRSAAAMLLGLRIRMPPGTSMSVCFECCHVEVSASCCSPVQRRPMGYCSVGKKWCRWLHVCIYKPCFSYPVLGFPIVMSVIATN